MDTIAYSVMIEETFSSVFAVFDYLKTRIISY